MTTLTTNESEQSATIDVDMPQRRHWLDAVIAGVVVLVVVGLIVLPLTARGWLMMLDWVPGPHPSIQRSFWGLDGALVSAMPFALSMIGIGAVLGRATVGWLPIAVGLGLGGIGMSQLLGGSWRRRIPAALLYCVNPF